MQEAVVGWLLRDRQFFMVARDKILPDWFVDPYCAKVWKICLGFDAKYRRQPTVEEVRSSHDILVMDQGDRTRTLSKMDVCLARCANHGLEVLRNDLTIWLKTRILKVGVDRVSTTFNAAMRDRSKYQETFGIFKKCAADMDRATFEPAAAVSWDDIENGSFIQEIREQRTRALTFGCPKVDQRLLPDCFQNRGLLRGDHTIILAPTNRGKTAAMISVIRANLLCATGDILWITHEGVPHDLKRKMTQSLLGATKEELIAMAETPDGQRKLRAAARYLRNHLAYVPMNKAGLVVEEVEVAVRMECERHLAETGRSFALLVDDYPAKLTTQMAARGHWPKRQIDAYIYANIFTQLGLELDMHVLSAIQTNRDGSKINQHRRGSERRLLQMEDVSESWDAMTTATNVISLNRDTAAEQAQRQTYHICKSRSNETGWSIVTKTKYDRAISHSYDLPHTVYHSIHNTNDKIDALIEQYNGKALPEGDFYYDLD